MKIIRREERGAEILSLIGHLTAASGVDVLRELEDELVNGSHRSLVLDLSAVGYLDAAGIGELLRLRRKAMARGTDLVLSGLPLKVREILDITRLADELNAAADTDEALERVARHSSRPRRSESRRPRRAQSQRYRIPVIVAL